MPKHMRIAFGIIVCWVFVPSAFGKDPVKKAKVELRWLEGERIEGVTENDGFQTTCDPKSVMFMHKKPAMVLTAVEVSETRLTSVKFLGSTPPLGELYSVEIHLTNWARLTLAFSTERYETRYLTVVVDGKRWGVCRYEKDEARPQIAPQARAKSFLPSVGFFTSIAEAQSLIDALKK